MATFKELEKQCMLVASAFINNGKKLEYYEYEFYKEMGVRFGLVGEELDKLEEFLFKTSPKEVQEAGGYEKFTALGLEFKPKRGENRR